MEIAEEVDENVDIIITNVNIKIGGSTIVETVLLILGQLLS